MADPLSEPLRGGHGVNLDWNFWGKETLSIITHTPFGAPRGSGEEALCIIQGRSRTSLPSFM